MNWHRSGKWFSVLALLVLVAVALPIAAAQPDGSKIEKDLLDKFAVEGSADFIVRFAAKADLAPAYQMDWHARGQFVVDALTRVATLSQAQAKAYLAGRGLRHETLVAGNDLYVWAGDLAAANALAAMPEVYFIRAPRTYSVDPIVEEYLAPEATTDWGITDTKADQFWAAFGVQGDGIVVANIDTGVQYNHPALAAQFKCPGDPTNPACWSDPSNVCGAGGACDNNGHGTHTMGTMVADDDQALPYIAGMAPNALWIACKGCESNSCSEYALTTCATWILQPGGSADNRPHVVNNSWGGGGCDNWYQSYVQAWVAAGIFPAFSAGNNTGCGSMGSPGDYQESFASTGHTSSRSHAWSQGPSCYGHEPYTKPNITAPSNNICSTIPTNSWSCGYSGTSMASPHSAGAVALLWSCNPSLIGQIPETFEALQNTADPPDPPNPACGVPPDGEGTYEDGYGYLNALEMGNTYCGGVEFGHLEGHVYDAGGVPIANASVTAVPGAGTEATTDPQGYYHMNLVPGTYNVTASKANYSSQTVTGIVITANVTETQDFALTFQGSWMPSTQPNCFDLTRIDAEFFPATGKVYVLGGRSGSATVGNIYAFDPVANTCVDTGAVMPVPISNYSVNLVNNGTTDVLCTFGGRDSAGAQTLAVQCYDPVANTAAQVATLPVAYDGYVPGAQVVVDNMVYVFGGFNPNTAPYELARTDRYDPVANTFTQLGDLSLARSYIMADVVDGKIYAFGGTIFDGASLFAQTRAEVMADPAGAGTWDDAAVADMPQAGAEGRAFGFDSDSVYGLPGKIILAPAYAQWSGDSNLVTAYDVASDTYDDSFPDLITARRDNAGVFVPLCSSVPDDGLPGMWVIGGRSGSDNPPYSPPEYFPLACPTAPVAAFSWDEPVCVGWPTQFNDESQFNPTEWYWDFDDGGFSTIQHPTHTFATVDEFLVTLTVTNTEGSSSIEHPVTVNPLPEASFIYEPQQGPAPLTVYFTDTSLYAITPTWYFGDLTPPETGLNVDHTYDTPGTYVVVMTATSAFGCGQDIATATVEVVEPVGLYAAFDADPTEGCEPLEVTFTDQSWGNPDILSWLWEFGDGMTSTLQNPPPHTYAAGVYEVMLTVTNISGTASATDTITAYPLPVATFDYDPMYGSVPLTVYFTNTTDPLLAITPTWNFGDGSPLETGDVVSHTYTISGTYMVTLTTFSPYGCGEAYLSQAVYAGLACLPVDITGILWDIDGCQVTFTPQLVGTEPILYLWSFGDGMTSTEAMPVHDYGTTGVYSGTLEVSNCEGQSSDMMAFTVAVDCTVPTWSVYLPIVYRGQ